MAKLSIKEAADKCCKKPKDIHVYVGRRKLIKGSDGTIDTTNIINKAFFDKYSITIPAQMDEVSEPEVLEKEPPKSNKKYKNSDVPEIEVRGIVNLEKLKAEKLTEEITALKLKNARLEGEVINTELIKQATFEVVNAFRVNLLIAAKSNLRNYLVDLGATNDQTVEAISNIEVLFNAHTTEAIENVKTAIARVL